MNIIFVDFDGPLVNGKSFLFPRADDELPKFDEFSIVAFNHWAKYSKAKIVLSTNWCWHKSVDELKYICKMNGLGFDYHEQTLTPKKMTSLRHDEIRMWIELYGRDGDKYLIVDDDKICQYLDVGKWINVDYYNGISLENFIEGCQYFEISFKRNKNV